jgi:hypothetical protein
MVLIIQYTTILDSNMGILDLNLDIGNLELHVGLNYWSFGHLTKILGYWFRNFHISI